MKGIIARHGYKAKRDFSKRILNLKRKPKRFCLTCGIELIGYHGNALRCGSERKKAGCAFEEYCKRNKAWKKKTKVWLKRNPEKRKIYEHRYYLKKKLLLA